MEGCTEPRRSSHTNEGLTAALCIGFITEEGLDPNQEDSKIIQDLYKEGQTGSGKNPGGTIRSSIN